MNVKQEHQQLIKEKLQFLHEIDQPTKKVEVRVQGQTLEQLKEAKSKLESMIANLEKKV